MPLCWKICTVGIVMFFYLADFNASKFLYKATEHFFLNMPVVAQSLLFRSSYPLIVTLNYLLCLCFCELTRQDYVPEMRIRLID